MLKKKVPNPGTQIHPKTQPASPKNDNKSYTVVHGAKPKILMGPKIQQKDDEEKRINQQDPKNENETDCETHVIRKTNEKRIDEQNLKNGDETVPKTRIIGKKDEKKSKEIMGNQSIEENKEHQPKKNQEEVKKINNKPIEQIPIDAHMEDQLGPKTEKLWLKFNSVKVTQLIVQVYQIYKGMRQFYQGDFVERELSAVVCGFYERLFSTMTPGDYFTEFKKGYDKISEFLPEIAKENKNTDWNWLNHLTKFNLGALIEGIRDKMCSCVSKYMFVKTLNSDKFRQGKIPMDATDWTILANGLRINLIIKKNGKQDLDINVENSILKEPLVILEDNQICALLYTAEQASEFAETPALRQKFKSMENNQPPPEKKKKVQNHNEKKNNNNDSHNDNKISLPVIESLLQVYSKQMKAFANVGKTKNIEELASIFRDAEETIKEIIDPIVQKDGVEWDNAKNEARSCLDNINENKKLLKKTIKIFKDCLEKPIKEEEEEVKIEKVSRNCTSCNKSNPIVYEHKNPCKLCKNCIIEKMEAANSLQDIKCGCDIEIPEVELTRIDKEKIDTLKTKSVPESPIELPHKEEHKCKKKTCCCCSIREPSLHLGCGHWMGKRCIIVLMTKAIEDINRKTIACPMCPEPISNTFLDLADAGTYRQYSMMLSEEAASSYLRKTHQRDDSKLLKCIMLNISQ